VQVLFILHFRSCRFGYCWDVNLSACASIIPTWSFHNLYLPLSAIEVVQDMATRSENLSRATGLPEQLIPAAASRYKILFVSKIEFCKLSLEAAPCDDVSLHSACTPALRKRSQNFLIEVVGGNLRKRPVRPPLSRTLLMASAWLPRSYPGQPIRLISPLACLRTALTHPTASAPYPVPYTRGVGE